MNQNLAHILQEIKEKEYALRGNKTITDEFGDEYTEFSDFFSEEARSVVLSILIIAHLKGILKDHESMTTEDFSIVFHTRSNVLGDAWDKLTEKKIDIIDINVLISGYGLNSYKGEISDKEIVTWLINNKLILKDPSLTIPEVEVAFDILTTTKDTLSIDYNLDNILVCSPFCFSAKPFILNYNGRSKLVFIGADKTLDLIVIKELLSDFYGNIDVLLERFDKYSDIFEKESFDAALFIGETDSKSEGWQNTLNLTKALEYVKPGGWTYVYNQSIKRISTWGKNEFERYSTPLLVNINGEENVILCKKSSADIDVVRYIDLYQDMVWHSSKVVDYFAEAIEQHEWNSDYQELTKEDFIYSNELTFNRVKRDKEKKDFVWVKRNEIYHYTNNYELLNDEIKITKIVDTTDVSPYDPDVNEEEYYHVDPSNSVKSKAEEINKHFIINLNNNDIDFYCKDDKESQNAWINVWNNCYISDINNSLFDSIQRLTWRMVTKPCLILTGHNNQIVRVNATKSHVYCFKLFSLENDLEGRYYFTESLPIVIDDKFDEDCVIILNNLAGRNTDALLLPKTKQLQQEYYNKKFAEYIDKETKKNAKIVKELKKLKDKQYNWRDIISSYEKNNGIFDFSKYSTLLHLLDSYKFKQEELNHHELEIQHLQQNHVDIPLDLTLTLENEVLLNQFNGNQKSVNTILEHATEVVDYCCNAFNMGVQDGEFLAATIPNELAKLCVDALDVHSYDTLYLPFAGLIPCAQYLPKCMIEGEESRFNTMATARLHHHGFNYQLPTISSVEKLKSKGSKYKRIFMLPQYDDAIKNNEFGISPIDAVYMAFHNHLEDDGKLVCILPLSYAYGSRIFFNQLIKGCYIKMLVALPDIFRPVSNNPMCMIVLQKKSNYSALLVDGREFVKQSSVQSNILDYDGLLQTINMQEPKYCYNYVFSKNRSNLDNYNLIPHNFLRNKLPELHDGVIYTPLSKLVKLISKHTHISTEILMGMSHGVVNVNNLTDQYINCEIADNKLENKILGGNESYIIDKSAILFSYSNSVKIGIIDEVPIHVNQNILAFEITGNVTREYILRELLSSYVLEQLKSFVIDEDNIENFRYDILSINIKVPTVQEQERIVKEDVKKDLTAAEEKIKAQFEEYVAETHMKKHAISQDLFNLRESWKNLLHVKDQNNGSLKDDDIFKAKHSMTVKEIMERIETCMKEVRTEIDNLTFAENKCFESEIYININSFIKDYIERNQDTEFEFIWSGDNGKDTTIYFSEEALKTIFKNIISNACMHGFKYRSNNKIKIEWEEEPKHINIYISNNGKPIEKRMQGIELFKFGSSSERGKKSEGDHVHSGIGCYQIRALMKYRNRGDVEVICEECEFPVKFKLMFYK